MRALLSLAAMLTEARAEWLAGWLLLARQAIRRYPNKFTPAPGSPERGLHSGTDTDKMGFGQEARSCPTAARVDTPTNSRRRGRQKLTYRASSFRAASPVFPT